MTATPHGAGSAALVVIGMQSGTIQGCWQVNRVIATITDLVARARLAGVPVVWVDDLHADPPLEPDTTDALAGLVREPGEFVVQKRYRDGFETSDLADTLAVLAAHELFVCGAWSDQSVRATLLGGLTRGFTMTLVEDAHTAPPREQADLRIPAESVVGVMNVIASTPGTPSQACSTLAAAEIDFGRLVPVRDEAVADEALTVQEDESDEAESLDAPAPASRARQDPAE
ncbi:MAG: isochorismatase family protein [Propionibacterium sp.]